MMKATVFLVMGLGLAACASDDDGGAGDGEDTLPKRGELASDPTIVSAKGGCSLVSEYNPRATLWFSIDATDPMGNANLGDCAVTIGSATDQDSYGESSSCYANFTGALGAACKVGDVHVIGITVSNDTGGVTTASVRVTVSP